MSMLALSLWRPWPTIILGPTGSNPANIPPKRLENRGQHVPRRLVGVDVALHACLKMDDETRRLMERAGYLLADAAHPSGIVGVMRIETSAGPGLGRVLDAFSREQIEWWFQGLRDGYAWKLSNVRRLPHPVPCRGQQMLGWAVPPDVEAAVREQLADIPAEQPTLRMTQREFDALGEYSMSIPTGTTIGKRWRRNVSAPCNSQHPEDQRPPDWRVGEYYEIGDPNNVGIRWYRVVIVEAPRP